MCLPACHGYPWFCHTSSIWQRSFQSWSPVYQLCHSFLDFKHIFLKSDCPHQVGWWLEIYQGSWGLMSFSKDGGLSCSFFFLSSQLPSLNLAQQLPPKQQQLQKPHGNINKWEKWRKNKTPNQNVLRNATLRLLVKMEQSKDFEKTCSHKGEFSFKTMTRCLFKCIYYLQPPYP